MALFSSLLPLLTGSLGRRCEALSAAEIAAAQYFQVAGYVRCRLPEQHPSRALLRASALALGARHAQISSELRALLRVWAELGIPALLFKGFALAEFDYQTPAERFYGDVDLLLPDDAQVIGRAVDRALALGWRSDGLHADPAHWTHECAHLYSPGGHVRLDVHRFITAWDIGSQRRVRRLTQAVWAASTALDWDGIPLRLMSVLDRAVVGVALCRCWGGDAGGLKVADYTDLEQLIARYGLRAEQLERRAKELGGQATWLAFRRVCSPVDRTFVPETSETEQLLLRAAARDGYNHRQLKWAARSRALARRLGLAAQLVPDVWHAWQGWKSQEDPRTILRSWHRPAHRHLSLYQQTELVATINWWTRLLYPRQSREGVCVPRAYATFRALRRWGHPAVFVSGVARGAGGVSGHAWIEDEFGVLEPYNEPLVRERFRELFRFPEGLW